MLSAKDVLFWDVRTLQNTAVPSLFRVSMALQETSIANDLPYILQPTCSLVTEWGR